MKVPFNKPFLTGRELEYLQDVQHNRHLSGNGIFTQKCQAWLEQRLGCRKVLLTHSCTAALEMAALLLDLQPGDEVILPSFTFVSTANAFVLRGAVPVFVDIRPDTLNIDERRIEAAITPRTRAIVPVHYAGVACEMDTILAIARRHRLPVIEDAAQALLSAYQGTALGCLGDLATLSFHETKNLISGEGGALLINNERFVSRAEVIWEKGTNRANYFRGEVDKYTWVDVGSSFLPSELIAAFLWAQLEEAEVICQQRRNIWLRYHAGYEGLERAGGIRRPVIPAECLHNGHLYYLLLSSGDARNQLISALKRYGINAVFHYVPLHSSPAGRRFGRAHGTFEVTDATSERLVRLPLWIGVERYLESIIAAVRSCFQDTSLQSAA